MFAVAKRRFVNATRRDMTARLALQRDFVCLAFDQFALNKNTASEDAARDNLLRHLDRFESMCRTQRRG